MPHKPILFTISSRAMKRFHIIVIISLMPLMLVSLLVVAVDPYNLFSTIYSEEKYNIGYGYDQGRRYKIFSYLNNPKDNVILGASEINVLNERNIPEEGWQSLSYGGAPLYESLEMYWVISKKHKLAKVIIAPEFIKYCLSISMDYGNDSFSNFKWKSSQSFQALEIYSKKYLYFTDKYTLKSMVNVLSNELGFKYSRGIPDTSKEEFWQEQLDYAYKVYAEDFALSTKKDDVKIKFQEIKKDADQHHTKILIILPIQHVDLLKIEFAGSVFDTYEEYINMLVEVFGEVHYLAYVENLSEKEECFHDPFHFNSSDLYIDVLFKKRQHLVINEVNAKESLDSLRIKINSNE